MGGFVGIDVSKDQLDVAFRPEGRQLQVGNDARGIARLVRMLKRSQPQLVVLEASGGYEAALFECLAAKQVPAALLNHGMCVSLRAPVGDWPRPTPSMRECWRTSLKS
jgi:transposase